MLTYKLKIIVLIVIMLQLNSCNNSRQFVQIESENYSNISKKGSQIIPPYSIEAQKALKVSMIEFESIDLDTSHCTIRIYDDKDAFWVAFIAGGPLKTVKSDGSFTVHLRRGAVVKVSKDDYSILITFITD